MKGESHASEDRIRPELNLEKWPGIWRPSKSNVAPAARTLRRETTRADGVRVTAEVRVGFTDRGNLTTEDQKTYYGLIKRWEDSGRTPEQASFSIRGLSRILNKKWGTNVIDAITASLKRLRTVPFEWTDSYEDGATGETVRKIEIFNVLSELKIVQRERDGVVNHAVGYFKFNDFILDNLLGNHTKPLLLDVILSFRSEIAQLLYIHVDLMMASRDRYERRSRELFEDLGLRGGEYGKPSQRKKKLDAALAELQDVRLSKGGTLGLAAIERTKDGTDYKVVFERGAIPSSRYEFEDRGFPVQPQQPRTKTAVTVQAEEVVSHFHKLFHNVTTMHPSSKEVSQAISLIANHGFEHAKYIVDFSHRAAARTNYAPQTFGGILQYTSRALADYEHYQRGIEAAAKTREESKARHSAKELRIREDDTRRAEAELRLASLPTPEYEALAAKVKADLLTRSQWLRQGETSPFFQRAVRFAMVSEIINMSEAGDAEAARPELA